MPRATIERPHAWYGVGNVDPNFHFTSEVFVHEGDSRHRPKTAQGPIWYVGGAPRDDLFQLADIRSNNTYDMNHPTYSVSGHLIAKMLGGVDEPENLVHVTKRTNDLMQGVENQLKGLHEPHWLKVTVDSYFAPPNGDARIPQKFTYQVWKGGTAPSPQTAPLRTWTVTQAWVEVGKFDYDDALLVLAAKLKTGMTFTNWRLETASNPLGGNFSHLANAMPKDLAKRPLAFLDYALIAHPETWERLGVTESNVIEYLNSLGVGESYKLSWVRQLALKGNILAHQNWLTSDVFGDRSSVIVQKTGGIVTEPHQHLIIGGGSDAPQVDHIVPESKGGCNAFSNAQITSQLYNGQKSNFTQTLEPRSQDWFNEMTRKLHEQGLGKDMK